MGRGSFPAWNAEGRGCKGGAGPTAGQKAATYEVELPDGTVIRKRTFFVVLPEALAIIYAHEGKWYVNSIVSGLGDLPDWAIGKQTVPARRVK